MAININNMCGQRFYHNCNKYCFLAFTSFATPKISQQHLQPEYIDVDLFQV
jgi:hypothetical protein